MILRVASEVFIGKEPIRRWLDIDPLNKGRGQGDYSERKLLSKRGQVGYKEVPLALTDEIRLTRDLSLIPPKISGAATFPASDQLKPGTYADIHFQAGVAAYWNGNLDTALWQFQQTLTYQPNPPPWFYLGETQVKTGLTREAAESYRHFLK